LRRWEELRPEFDRRDVQIVTVSADTPKELRDGHGAHGLKARMLSDRDLAVTDAFGLRNQGIHSGPPFGAEALPVPTSLLIDGDGKVLWMDQSENYQRRSGPDSVLAALRTHLES
jgi:peroxiredoxin